MNLFEIIGLAPKIERLSPREAHEGCKRGDVVIIDVRTPGEWARTGSPCGSHRISLGDSKLAPTVNGLLAANPNATIALSCLSGNRAKAAARRLKKAGVKPIAKGPVTLPKNLNPEWSLTIVRDPDGNLVELVGPKPTK